jgi:hypothetical protein
METGADGCHPSFAEKPILVSLLALAMCLIAGACFWLATKMSMNDLTAGAVVDQDNGTLSTKAKSSDAGVGEWLRDGSLVEQGEWVAAERSEDWGVKVVLVIATSSFNSECEGVLAEWDDWWARSVANGEGEGDTEKHGHLIRLKMKIWPGGFPLWGGGACCSGSEFANTALLWVGTYGIHIYLLHCYFKKF